MIGAGLACGTAAPEGAPDAPAPTSAPPPPGDAGRPEESPTARVDAGVATGAACDRRTQAAGAPASLFDAVREELGALATAARAARVDRFLAEVRARGGTPLEDGDRVVFLARGSTRWEVALADASVTPLARVVGTDLWAVELTIPRAQSFTYRLLSGGAAVEDPLAGHVAWDGVDVDAPRRGRLAGVGHAAALPAGRGRLVALGPVRATALADERTVLVYLPPRFDDGSCAELPSILLHDGRDAVTQGDFVAAADQLFADRPELSAALVFVDLPSEDVRQAQYGFGEGFRAPEYVAFLADDLWPAVATRFRLCRAPDARGISGASLGGLVSTFAAFERPGTWGWVGAQSGSFFWGDEALAARAARQAKVPTRFYLDSGCPEDNCEVTDRMADVMRGAGYDVVRVTAPGARHEWSAWRARFAGMLASFRGGRGACR